MTSSWLPMISALLLAAIAATTLQTAAPLGDGWKKEGDARIDGSGVHFGAGKGAVRKRYDVPGLRILWYGATITKSGDDVKAGLRLQCFDRRGKSLMDVSAEPDKKHAAGIYLKSHAFTSYVVLTVEKTSAGGSAKAADVVLKDNDKDRIEHGPKMNLDFAMQPIWMGDVVYEESVLLLENESGEHSGRLLFAPTKIVSVKDPTLSKTYLEGTDFTIEGNELKSVQGSSIQTMDKKELATGQYPWTQLQGRHVFVTYRHKAKWSGPKPTYQGDRLPETLAKLKAKKPLTVVAYGDSITLGINVSGFLNVPPYLPPWPSLFVRQLGLATGDKDIKLYNTALGGMTSDWAKENAKTVVATLNPDLVMIAFGMNDFWSIEPPAFRKNIEAVMATVRAKRPKCEFILISSMKFDPSYTTEEPYVGNLIGYAKELGKLAGKGVAFLDMTTISDALYQAKSAKDLGTDPMHPDDFLSRWYAQGVLATLVKF